MRLLDSIRGAVGGAALAVLVMACASRPPADERPHIEAWPASPETRNTLGIEGWTLDGASDGSSISYIGRAADGSEVTSVTYRRDGADTRLELDDGSLTFHADTTLDVDLPNHGRWEQVIFGLLLDRTAAGRRGRGPNGVATGGDVSLAQRVRPMASAAPGVEPVPPELVVSRADQQLIVCRQAQQNQQALTAMQAALSCTDGPHVEPRVNSANVPSDSAACARQRDTIAALRRQVDEQLESDCAVQLIDWDLDWLLPSCNDVAKMTGVLTGIVGQGLCASAATATGVAAGVACSPTVVGAAVCGLGAGAAVEIACLPVAVAAGAGAYQAALPTCEYIRMMTNGGSQSSSRKIEYRFCTKPRYGGDRTEGTIVECACDKPVSECKCPGTNLPPEHGVVGGQSSCDRSER